MPLVLELQRNAMDPTVSIEVLLLRALTIAVKLSLADFQIWIEHELHGYAPADVPDYRQIQGMPMSRAFGKTRPLVFRDTHIDEVLSCMPVGWPISQIDRECKSDQSYVTCAYPSGVRNVLLPYLADGVFPVLVISRNSLTAVVDRVRAETLRWTLRLEARGIVGNDVGVSHDEETKAHKCGRDATKQITITIGEMTNSAMQILSSNSNLEQMVE